MTLVLANGVFDLLHVGHLDHLKEARAMGTHLAVALTVDEAVGKGPGRPVQPWDERAAILRELRCVDFVIPSSSGAAAVLMVRPAIYVKGIDYAGADIPERAVCARVGAQLRFTRSAKKSTTELIRRMQACAC